MPSARERAPSTAPPSALVTLGRLPVALEICRALAEGGWRVVVAEPLRWHLCRLSRAVARCRRVPAPARDPDAYLDALSTVVREEGISLVVPVSEETPHVAGLRGRLPAGVGLVCPPRETLLALHDKWRFVERARALGLAVPETALAGSGAGARIAARGPHVIKPRLSCSGVGVVSRARGGALEPALRDDALIVQRRLGGAARCAFAVASGGRLRQLVVYRTLIEAGSVGVMFERVAAAADIVDFVARLVAAERYAGLIAFDFIADTDGRHHAIECNPRATSGLHFLGPGRTAALDRTAALGRTAAGGPTLLQMLIDNSTLTPAEPPDTDPQLLPLGTRRQEFWSALAELQARALLRGRVDRGDWKRLATTRDVDWSRDDPLPFLGMVPASLPLLLRALRARRPITEVTMAEMGWYETATSSSPRGCGPRGEGDDGREGEDRRDERAPAAVRGR